MTTKISGDNISSIANTGVTWNAVTVADGSTQLNASAGNGYFLDTNAGVIEVFLPTTPTRGDTVILMDYAGTFATNQVIVNTGTTNLDSTTTREYKLTTNDTITEFIYVDAAKGWVTRINTTTGTTPSGVFNDKGGYDTIGPFIEATGGTVTTSGDYKIHTFTGDGCFVVTNQGTPAGSDTVDYLVVAGGGGASGGQAGAGGAGGFRESSGAASGCYSASPLGACVSGITVTATTYPVTVGAGGSTCSSNSIDGVPGSNSIFSTITSTGGGGGAKKSGSPAPSGLSGGSAGGNAACGPATAGAGNTPPVSPPQGQPGGSTPPSVGDGGAAGGGGALNAGSPAVNRCAPGGPGGDGAQTSINGSATYYAGGGAAGNGGNTPNPAPSKLGGDGGLGGGGDGGDIGTSSQSGTANTGGGGGALGNGSGCQTSGSGGKGIVIIRYKFQ